MKSKLFNLLLSLIIILPFSYGAINGDSVKFCSDTQESTAPADYIYYQDGNQNNFINRTDGISVQPSPKGYLNISTTNNDKAAAIQAFSPVDYGIVTLKYDILLYSLDPVCGFAAANKTDPITASSNVFIMYFHPSFYWDVYTGTHYPLGIPPATATWYNFTEVFNMTSKTFDVYWYNSSVGNYTLKTSGKTPNGDVSSLGELRAWCNVGMFSLTNVRLYNGTQCPTQAPNQLISIIFSSQKPADITTTNAFGSTVNITYSLANYNISNSIILEHFVNDSTSINNYYVNGTPYLFIFNNSYTSSLSDSYTFNIMDYFVYPGTYNYNQTKIENTEHKNLTVTNLNIIKNGFYNIQNKPYSYLELDAVPLGVNDLELYYCNSSYVSGNPATAPNCFNFFNIPNAQNINHSHSNYSKHYLIPFPINNGSIGTIKISSLGYIIHTSSGLGWNLRVINNTNSRINNLQTSNDNGATYSNYNAVADEHIHFFSNVSSLCYSVYAYNLSNGLANSGVNCDLLQFGGLSPSNPEIKTPVAGFYKGNIFISWHESTSPNGYNITRYKIDLLNNDNSFNSFIQNVTALNYTYNSLLAADNQYKIKVTAYDSMGQTAQDISQIFNIMNDYANLTQYAPNPTYNETYNIIIFINISSSKNVTCSINDSSFNQTTANSTFYSWNSNDNLTAGFHTVKYICCDSANNCANASAYFSRNTGIPVITVYSPLANSYLSPTKSQLLLNMTFSDDVLLYDYNISILNDFSVIYYTAALLTTPAYNFTSVISATNLTNGSLFLSVHVCDAHTLNSITPAKGVIEQKNALLYDFGGVNIEIKALDNASIGTKTDYLGSRYDFNFYYSDKSATREYQIITDDPVTYLYWSPYKAHFVVNGIKKYWIDFENEKAVTVKYNENDKTYHIIVESGENAEKFYSIGELNCNTLVVPFTKSEIPSPYNIDLLGENWFNADVVNLNTTTGVLIYGLMLLIVIVFGIVAIITRIPVFYMFTALLGFFFGWLLLVTLSVIMGVMFMIGSLLFMLLAFI